MSSKINLIFVLFIINSFSLQAQMGDTTIINQNGYKNIYTFYCGCGTPSDTIKIELKAIGPHGYADLYIHRLSPHLDSIFFDKFLIEDLALNNSSEFPYLIKIPAIDIINKTKDFGGYSMYLKLGENGRTPDFTISFVNGIIPAQELIRKDIQVSIYNSNGQYMKESNSKDYKQNLPQGLYFFKGSSDKEVYTGKYMVSE